MKVRNRIAKQNNEGFTLVEILIAITILTLVLSPMMGAFVTTAKINAKAQIRQEATVVAENFFEGIKNFGIEELKKQCTTFSASTFNIIAGEVGGAEVTSMSTDASTGEKKYLFTVKNVKVNDATFDNVKIQITQDLTKTNTGDAAIDAVSDAQFTTFNLRKKSYYDVVVTVYRGTGSDEEEIAEFSGSVLDYI